MRVYAPTPFRYPAQTGKDYPFGYQDIADDTLARTLVAASLVQDATLPGSGVAAAVATPVAFTLLNNVSAAGAGTAVTWPGGHGQFSMTGTFGGTSGILQYSPDGGTTYLPAGSDTTLPDVGGGAFYFAGPTKIRAFLSGGSPVGVSAFVAGTTP